MCRFPVLASGEMLLDDLEREAGTRPCLVVVGWEWLVSAPQYVLGQSAWDAAFAGSRLSLGRGAGEPSGLALGLAGLAAVRGGRLDRRMLHRRGFVVGSRGRMIQL